MIKRNNSLQKHKITFLFPFKNVINNRKCILTDNRDTIYLYNNIILTIFEELNGNMNNIVH